MVFKIFSKILSVFFLFSFQMFSHFSFCFLNTSSVSLAILSRATCSSLSFMEVVVNLVGQMGVVVVRQEEECVSTLLELRGLQLAIVEVVELLDELVPKRGHVELLSDAGMVEAEGTRLHGEQERVVAGLGAGQTLLFRAK